MNKKTESTNWYLKKPFVMSKIILKCFDDSKNFEAYCGCYDNMMGLFEELKSPTNDILLSQFKKNYREEFKRGNKTKIFDKFINSPIFFYKVALPGTDDFVISPVFDFSNMDAVKLVKMTNAAATNDVELLHKLSPYSGRTVDGNPTSTTSADTSAEQSADTESLLEEKQNTPDNEYVNSNDSNSSTNIVIVRDKVTVKEKKNIVKKKMDCSDTPIPEFNLEECVNGLPLQLPTVQNAIKQADKTQAKIIRDNWDTAKTIFYEICLGRQADKLTSEYDVLKYLFNLINRMSTRKDFVDKICERTKDNKPNTIESDPYRFENRDEKGNRSYNGIPIPKGMPPRPSMNAVLKNGRWRA